MGRKYRKNPRFSGKNLLRKREKQTKEVVGKGREGTKLQVWGRFADGRERERRKR